MVGEPIQEAAEEVHCLAKAEMNRLGAYCRYQDLGRSADLHGSHQGYDSGNQNLETQS